MKRDQLNRNQYILPWSPGRTISTEEAGDMLGVTSETIRKMIDEGELEAVRIRPRKVKSPWRVFRESVLNHRACIAREYHVDLNKRPEKPSTPPDRR